MSTKTKLTLNSKDSKGVYPTRDMIGKSYFHLKSRCIYQVTGFVWDASLDEWKIKYSKRGDSIEFTRNIDEFKDGRFIEIEEGVERDE